MHAIGLTLCAMFAVGLPAHAVVLRYAPKVGDTVKHKVSVAGRTSSVVESMDDPMADALRMEISGAIQYTEKALSETPDSVRVETRVAGGKFTMSAAGQVQEQPVPKGTVVADMDRRGRLVKVIETDLGGKSGVQDFMMGGMGGAGDLPNFSGFGVFPEGDVRPGATWTDGIQIPAKQGGPGMNLSLSSRLLDLATFQDRKCAKIRTTFSGPLTFGSAHGVGAAGEMEATMQGDLIWYYDYENSVYVSGEGQVGMNMSMNVSAPEMPGMPVSIKMLINVKLSLMK
jgi:hypothetical protein